MKDDTKQQGTDTPDDSAIWLRGRGVLICLLASAGLWQIYFPPAGIWPVGIFIPGLFALAALGGGGGGGGAGVAGGAGGVAGGGVACGRKWFFIFWLVGTLCWAMAIYWMTWVTPVGWLGLSIYMGLYWPVGAWWLRRLNKFNLPAAITLPVVVVTLELARARLLSGFPWFLLSHGMFKNPIFIQISDFAGAYGPSFVIAALGGTLADWAILYFNTRNTRCCEKSGLRRCVISSFVSLLLLGATLGYGAIRLSQADDIAAAAESDNSVRVAVAQSAFPISIYADRSADSQIIFDNLVADTMLADGRDVDLLIWPETVLPNELAGPLGYDLTWSQVDTDALSPEWVEYCRMRQGMHRDIATLLKSFGGVSLLSGAITVEKDASAPNGINSYNSAMLITPSKAGNGDQADETKKTDPLKFGPVYGKMHCVPFGEYTPFRFTVPPLYKMLRFFVPDEMEQLTPGRRPLRFNFEASDGTKHDFATAICYEGVIPRVCRKLIWHAVDEDGQPVSKKADFLVNISNDGWFIWPFGKSDWPSGELDQHMSVYPFRAIENRVSLVRAVNTGISCAVDSSGRITKIIADDAGQYKMVRGSMTADMQIDDRRPFYGLYGDIFAWSCSVLAMAGLVAAKYIRKVKND